MGAFLYPVAVAAVFFPKVRTHWLTWAAMSAVLGLANIAFFQVNDDHQFLFNYWTIALALVLTVPAGKKRAKLLAFNARMLIGLTFLFATFWKLTSSDFTSGALFEYLLEFDVRLCHIASMLTDLS